MLSNNISSSVKVAVRVRPPQQGEEGMTAKISYLPGHQIVLKGGSEIKSFTFDFVFDQTAEQKGVYTEAVAPLIAKFMDGYSATILAYGQTGSGKTYSMGTALDEKNISESLVGIVPRAIDAIYAHIENAITLRPDSEYDITASFLELYNEDLVDLLARAQPKTGIPKPKPSIREDESGAVFLSNICEEKATNAKMLIGLLDRGSASRTTAATEMNSTSSRSHAIFTITLKQKVSMGVDGGRITTISKFNFVDLAGSERLKKTNSENDRKKEGISINQGLLALGNVISALGDESRKATHVPYRDSKLTRMLQESLGGNSQTLMLACISPLESNYSESLATLHYANRARNIQNKIQINQKWDGGVSNQKEIKSLQDSIGKLQIELDQTRADYLKSSEATQELGAKLEKAQKLVGDHKADAERMLAQRNDLLHQLETLRKNLHETEASLLQKTDGMRVLEERLRITEATKNDLLIENKTASETKTGLLLRMDELSSEKTQMWQEKASLNSQFIALKQHSEQLQAQLTAEHVSSEKAILQLKELEVDLSTTRSNARELEQQKSDLEVRFAEFERQHTLEIQKHSEEKNSIQLQLTDQYVELLQVNGGLNSKIELLTTSNTQLQESNSLFEKQVLALQESIQTMTLNRDSLNSEKTDQLKRTEELDAINQELKVQNSKLLVRLKEVEMALESIVKKYKKLQTLNSESEVKLSSQNSLLSEFEAKERRLLDSLSEAKAEIKSLVTSSEQLSSSTQAESNAVKEELDTLKDELDAVKIKFEIADAECKRIKVEKSSLEQFLSIASSQEKQATSKSASLEAKLADLQQKLKNVKGKQLDPPQVESEKMLVGIFNDELLSESKAAVPGGQDEENMEGEDEDEASASTATKKVNLRKKKDSSKGKISKKTSAASSEPGILTNVAHLLSNSSAKRETRASAKQKGVSVNEESESRGHPPTVKAKMPAKYLQELKKELERSEKA